MHIDDITTKPIRSLATGPTEDAPGEGDRREPAPAERAQPADRVDISDEGRVLAAHREDATATSAGDMSAERLVEIRDRIRTGEYDSVDVAEAVARRMLERGDA